MTNKHWHKVSYNLYGTEKFFEHDRYTILYNDATESFVVAYCYNPEDNTWGQGHYFDDIYSALEFFINATNG